MRENSKLIDILLVEDNPGDVELTREEFEGGKFRNALNVARDGDEALDFLFKRGSFSDAKTPDLILLDLNLPKTDGREVLEVIKSDEVLKKIPVIILTSSQMDRDVLEDHGLPSTCYIVKPISMSQLLNVLKKLEEFWIDIVRTPAFGS